jgi:hypothetical protein
MTPAPTAKRVSDPYTAEGAFAEVRKLMTLPVIRQHVHDVTLVATMFAHGVTRIEILKPE